MALIRALASVAFRLWRLLRETQSRAAGMVHATHAAGVVAPRRGGPPEAGRRPQKMRYMREDFPENT